VAAEGAAEFTLPRKDWVFLSAPLPVIPLSVPLSLKTGELVAAVTPNPARTPTERTQRIRIVDLPNAYSEAAGFMTISGVILIPSQVSE
jgi:hypothetical protein